MSVGLDKDAECEEMEVDLDEDTSEEIEEEIPDNYEEEEE
jgi:hypothetical protein